MVSFQERWFPAKESTSVVGRFIDAEMDDPPASEKAGKKITKMVTVLHSKVAGSIDVAAQWVRDEDIKRELADRFPGAWEYYQKMKRFEEDERKGAVDEDDPVIDGTPLEDGDLFNAQRIAWFKSQGMYTLEQVRDMSDSTIENLGRSGGMGARGWRKKATEHLAAKRR